MRSNRFLSNRGRRQRGATFVIAMVLMLLMTVVTLTSFKAIKTDERLAGNLQDRTVAFQAAEAALREAEATLELGELTGSLFWFYSHAELESGVVPPEPVDTNGNSSDDFTGDVNARIYGQTIEGVAALPLYIVEQLGTQMFGTIVVGQEYAGSGEPVYRITAVGFGGSPTTRVVLQSTYKRPTFN